MNVITKKTIYKMKKALLWSVVALMVLSSCQDEFIKNNNKTSEMIGYSVKTNTISDPLKVRASRSSGTTDVAIEQLSQSLGGKQLYLHTVTDMVVPMDIKAPKKQDKNTAAQSRGTEVTDASQINEIGVTSVVWNGDSWEDATDKRRYMNDVEAESPNFQTNYYWPAAEENIRFFAYSPKSAGEIAESDDNATLTFDYTVPENVTAQHDLLVASSNEPGNKKAAADLHFGHALTAVQFVIDAGVPGITITGVSIKGVYKKGTYTYNYCGRNGVDGDSDTPDSDTGEWVLDKTAGTGEFVINDLNVSTGDGTARTLVNTGENVFMMLPHEGENPEDKLPESAVITVTIKDVNGDLVNIEGSIAGRTWQKGTKVTYIISLKSSSEVFIFNIVDSEGNIISSLPSYPWHGGIGEYAVKSYKEITDIAGRVTYSTANWKVKSMDGIDYVDAESGEGVDDPDKIDGPYTYGVLPGTITSTTDIHENMAAYEERGTKETPWDLSMMDNINGGWNGNAEVLNAGGQHTANCYIVRAPGYYMFPVVYGNAIEKGKTNVDAYNPGENKSVTVSAKRYNAEIIDGETVYTENGDNSLPVDYLGNFVDHKGENIKGPWIADQGANYEPTSARIIWQDAPCLVTQTEVIEINGQHYVRFRVPKESICEGNAVVAVCSDETKLDPVTNKEEPVVMWSWHIWVSNGSLYAAKTLTNRRVLGNYAKGDTEASNWTREESTFGIFQSQLGYCSADYRTYDATGGSLTLVQIDDNGVEIAESETTLTFTRSESKEVRAAVNAPVYQWGRKDPMLPFHNNAVSGTVINKPYYDNDRNYYEVDKMPTNKYAGPKDLSLSIQEPEIFFTTPDDVSVSGINKRNWCNKNYINLWNAKCDVLPMFSYLTTMLADEYHKQFNDVISKGVVKTVYDPCPPGWEMPRLDAFTGITLDGTTVEGYYRYVAPNCEFQTTVNLGKQSIVLDPRSQEISVFRRPMPRANERIGSTVSSSENVNLFWMMGLGHRGATTPAGGFEDNSAPNMYGTYVSGLTSSMVLMQFFKYTESTNTISVGDFELNSVRFACMSQNLPSNYTGTLKPMSFSFPDLAFGVFAARTGMNPYGTKVLSAGTESPYIQDVYPKIFTLAEESGLVVEPTGNIKPWEDGGNISIEF